MSALANAEHNYDMNTDELGCKAYANEGPTLNVSAHVLGRKC